MSNLERNLNQIIVLLNLKHLQTTTQIFHKKTSKNWRFVFHSLSFLDCWITHKLCLWVCNCSIYEGCMCGACLFWAQTRTVNTASRKPHRTVSYFSFPFRCPTIRGGSLRSSSSTRCLFTPPRRSSGMRTLFPQSIIQEKVGITATWMCFIEIHSNVLWNSVRCHVTVSFFI